MTRQPRPKIELPCNAGASMRRYEASAGHETVPSVPKARAGLDVTLRALP